MLFRPALPADIGRLLPLVAPDAASPLTGERYAAQLAAGQYRPEWTWIADDGGSGPPAAAAVWWGRPGDELPAALDAVHVRAGTVPPAGRVALAAALLTAAHTAYAAAGLARPPAFHFFLPAEGDRRAEVAAALEWRRAAAARAGLTEALERLRFDWTAECGLPAPDGRLRFAAEADDEVFAELFRRVLAGSLDAASTREAARIGAAAQARADLAFLRDTMRGPRDWWRVARTPAGEPVGFAVPSRNLDAPVVGYLGVLPEHRGHGYAAGILGELTRVLAAHAPGERVRADTDLANTPMAAAFIRTGYRQHGRRLVLSAG